MNPAAMTAVSFGFKEAAAKGWQLYIDGSGQPAWSTPMVPRVGAGAVILNWSGPFHISSAGLLLTSVPARQTVPRAEAYAGIAALDLYKAMGTKPDAWKSDASYVVGGYNDEKKASEAQQGCQW